MQSRPIRKKKDSSTKIVSIALVVSWLIIFAGVRWVFYGQSSNELPTNLIDEDNQIEDGTDEIEEKSTWYIGEQILAEGVLTATESFTTYTHDFVSEQGNIFGLKSRDIDLYSFEGKVQIKGSIDDFNMELPIILVEEIVGDRSGGVDAGSADITANDNYYLFQDEKIGFDLSISQGFIVERDGEEIHLNDATNDNETVLKISPFVCTPGDPLKDCVQLEASFIDRNSDTFISGQGVKFYNLTETITWLAFDPTGAYGYYLTPTNEQDFVSFANLMGYMNEGILKEAIDEDVATLCKNINYTIETADNIAYDYSTLGAVRATINSIASDGAELNCVIGLRLGNSIETQAISFEVTGDNLRTTDDKEEITDEDNTQEDEEEVVADEEEPDEEILEDADTGLTPPENAVSAVPENWSGAGWFNYNSVRGYDVYFSSKSISYAGTILSPASDLGVDGLSCNYRVNIIQRQRAEEVDTAPDVQLYECTGSAAGSSTLRNVGSSGDKTFYAKWNTTNLGDMSIVVE